LVGQQRVAGGCRSRAWVSKAALRWI
jgi:hypothetical protein